MKKRFLIFIVVGLMIASEVSCIQSKRIAYTSYPNELQSNLTELNDVSKEIHEIAKVAHNWRDIATILLVNELIVEITNLLLIDKLSTASASIIKDEYRGRYLNNVKIKLGFIRETIQKNHKGIHMLSKTYSIRSNESVVNELDKADRIIRSSLALLDRDIEGLE